jgi:uncharacterized protein (DUF305 family)
MKILPYLLAIVATFGLVTGSVGQTGGYDTGTPSGADPDWPELLASMDKMRAVMGSLKQSGNSDVDFVKLMLPHHQAALDMAKTQLVYGKDPQMRRLAQRIITAQQSEIDLMQRWLAQQQPVQVEINPASSPSNARSN